MDPTNEAQYTPESEKAPGFTIEYDAGDARLAMYINGQGRVYDKAQVLRIIADLQAVADRMPD